MSAVRARRSSDLGWGWGVDGAGRTAAFHQASSFGSRPPADARSTRPGEAKPGLRAGRCGGDGCWGHARAHAHAATGAQGAPLCSDWVRSARRRRDGAGLAPLYACDRRWGLVWQRSTLLPPECEYGIAPACPRIGVRRARARDIETPGWIGTRADSDVYVLRHATSSLLSVLRLQPSKTSSDSPIQTFPSRGRPW